MLKISVKKFGDAMDELKNESAEILCYTMTNSNQMTVSILNRGATIQSIKCPDRDGNIDDVCMGFETINQYVRNKHLYMGATLGRVANRVYNGQYQMDDKTIELTKNFKDEYHLNGGFTGFDSVIWKVLQFRNDGIVMQHINPDRHEGYPGKLTVTITFTLDESNSLRVHVEATSTKRTPVNITHQIYLNLAGHAARLEGLAQHNVIIKANNIVDIGNDLLPTGSIMPVKRTPYDLRQYTNLGRRLKKFINMPIKGFNHTYCLDCPVNMDKYVAKIIHPCSGRYLAVYTDRPAIHFFTAHNLPEVENNVVPIKGKDNKIYVKDGAFCLQPQHYPDFMNNSHFPSIFVGPREKYSFETVYKFGFYKV